jgi:hypothetical protein
MKIMTIYYLVLLAVLNWVVYSFITEYKKAEGSGFERLINAARGSATVLWSKFVIAVGAVASVLMGAADALNMPEVKTSIQIYLTPEHTALLLIGVAVVTQWARGRTLSDD